MDIVLFFLLSLVPAFLLFLYISKNGSKREGFGTLCKKAFLSGVLSIFSVLLCSGALHILFGHLVDKEAHPFLFEFLNDVIATAFAEELCKYLHCRFFIEKQAKDASALEVVSYMTLVALGFEVMECIPYAIGASPILMLVRGVTLMHATYGFMIGRLMAKGRKKGTRAYDYLAVFITTVLHGAYDLFLSPWLTEAYDWTAFIPVSLAFLSIVEVVILFFYYRKHKNEEEYNTPILSLPAETQETVG